MQTLPTTAKFAISKNFYNDVNGNPRIFFEIFDKDMNYLGFIQDNYAGTNFLGGRPDLSIIRYEYSKSGIRDYKKSLKGDIEFKNERLKD